MIPPFLNFGLEAISTWLNTSQDKRNSASRVNPSVINVAPTFSSAWQICKSNSATSVRGLRLHQLEDPAAFEAGQSDEEMKELVDSIKKEEDKFSVCEEARKQVVALERQTVLSAPAQRPPPLTSQLLQRQEQSRVVENSEVKTSRVSLNALNSCRVENNVIQANS